MLGLVTMGDGRMSVLLPVCLCDRGLYWLRLGVVVLRNGGLSDESSVCVSYGLSRFESRFESRFDVWAVDCGRC